MSQNCTTLEDSSKLEHRGGLGPAPGGSLWAPQNLQETPVTGTLDTAVTWGSKPFQVAGRHGASMEPGEAAGPLEGPCSSRSGEQGTWTPGHGGSTRRLPAALPEVPTALHVLFLRFLNRRHRWPRGGELAQGWLTGTHGSAPTRSWRPGRGRSIHCAAGPPPQPEAPRRGHGCPGPPGPDGWEDSPSCSQGPSLAH